MKRKGVLLVATLFLACVSEAGPADARGPSTPQEREDFVALVQALERDPLGDNANATRQRLQEWMFAVPDIRFKVCTDLLENVLGDDYPYTRELSQQALLSSAALTITDPGKARDDAAVYTAGVEGTLRAYEILIRARPDARRAALDHLIKKRRRGELAGHIAVLTRERCKRTNAGLIAAPIGAAAGLVMALIVARWFGGGTPGRTRVPGGVTPTRADSKVVAIYRAVFFCASYYFIVGVALHFLHTEYDPRYFPMSHYAWGSHGWLMTSTFFVLGLALLLVALGLRSHNPSSQSARIGFGLLIIAALFVSLAGVFRGFPLHDVASAVGLTSLAMAVLLLSWTFRRTNGWKPIWPISSVIAVVMLGSLVSIILDVGMPGLQQRAFLFLLLLWLLLVAHRLVRIAAGEDRIETAR